MSVGCGSIGLPPWLKCVGLGLNGSLLDKMSDNIYPFIIPGQDSCPDLESFVRLDLLPEVTADASESDRKALISLFC